MPKFNNSLIWFRRDLRTFDHASLYHALKQSRNVFCVFIFDQAILKKLPRQDRRVEFIQQSILEVANELLKLGGYLIVRQGVATEEIPRLAMQLHAEAVFVNHDYEPEAIERDCRIANALRAKGCAWFSFKDQVIVEKDELLTQTAKPYSVFTPYKNAWLKKLHADNDELSLQPYSVASYHTRLAPPTSSSLSAIPALSDIGFEQTNLAHSGILPGMSGGQRAIDAFLPRLKQYHRTRDFPALKGTSHLSVHLRFGTVSIRGLIRRVMDAIRTEPSNAGAAVWLSELIWREFYFMILYHHPFVTHRSFKPEYDAIRWESGPAAHTLYQAWCHGTTGYPLVDAAMMQLNQTGYMHNRLRMVTASFLVKDLGIDWRWGERYFAEKLLDYDLSANNGGWQWAASCGCDAQPYFRIFNPITQSAKFDPDGKFIKQYLPQLFKLSSKSVHAPWQASLSELRSATVKLGKNYPHRIVQHEEARKSTLVRYNAVKKPG